MGQRESNIAHCTNSKKFFFSFLSCCYVLLGGIGVGIKDTVMLEI